jgi:hypothetical protein
VGRLLRARAPSLPISTAEVTGLLPASRVMFLLAQSTGLERLAGVECSCITTSCDQRNQNIGRCRIQRREETGSIPRSSTKISPGTSCCITRAEALRCPRCQQAVAVAAHQDKKRRRGAEPHQQGDQDPREKRVSESRGTPRNGSPFTSEEWRYLATSTMPFPSTHLIDR